MPGLGTTRHRRCIWADCSLSWVTSKRKRAYEGTRVRIADQREGTSGRRSGGEACRQDDRGRPGPAHGSDRKGRPGQGGIETGRISHDKAGGVTFTTAGHGVLGASGVDGLQRGAVIWEVTEGRGQFAGATGLITSNFTV